MLTVGWTAVKGLTQHHSKQGLKNWNVSNSNFKTYTSMVSIYIMKNPDTTTISEHVQCCEKKNN